MMKKDLERGINEKDIENIYRTAIKSGLDGCNISSPYGVDGLLEFAPNVRTLLEFKYQDTLKNPLSQANILVQCLYYLKKFEDAGKKLPSTIFIGDQNECFAMHVNGIVKYLGKDIDWKIAPSIAHKRNPDIVKAMVNDTDIMPFVNDITEAFNIKTVIDQIKDLSDNVVRKVRVTKNNITPIFDYFSKNILESVDISTNQKANLFVQLIINQEDNYLNPGKENILITRGFGRLPVNSRLFKSFFKHFEGSDYSPREKEELTTLVDRLVEDTIRRNKGEFFTPTPFVDLAHSYLAKTFGDDWREKYVVWDCAAGTMNLTRDYKFKELYVSTLEQSDLETGTQMGYNKGATLFQYDFLNDGALPATLTHAIESGKEMIFLINPPPMQLQIIWAPKMGTIKLGCQIQKYPIEWEMKSLEHVDRTFMPNSYTEYGSCKR